MTNTGMYLPPPKVTGMAIPNNIVGVKSDVANYREIVNTRNAERDSVNLEMAKYAKKDKHKTPAVIKFFAGLLSVGTIGYLIKKAIKK